MANSSRSIPRPFRGPDKNRLMSESARGEGGRVWTYKDGKPWYFLEEKYPAYGNLVPRDIATREIYDVIYNQHLGVNGENVVYLDVSHIDPAVLDNKLGGILEIYEKFVGDDPRKVPMRIAPSVHYSMGGLWVDVDQSTNIRGCSRQGSATIRSMVPIVWVRTRCFRRYMLAWQRVRQPLHGSVGQILKPRKVSMIRRPKQSKLRMRLFARWMDP